MTALIQAKIESTGNPVARDALDQLKTFLIGERRKSLIRAREKLSRYDLIDFISRSQALLFSAGRNGAEKTLSVRISDAVDDWLRALDAANEAAEPELHGATIVDAKPTPSAAKPGAKAAANEEISVLEILGFGTALFVLAVIVLFGISLVSHM